MNNFSINLRLLRLGINESQAHIADTLGFKRTTWNNYEKGRSHPGLTHLLQIAKYFGVSLTELVEMELNKNPALVQKAIKNRSYDPLNSIMLSEPAAEYILATKELSKRLIQLEKTVKELKNGKFRSKKDIDLN